jgi:hypothetical protein
MRVIWLAWYICGVCLLLALLASAITCHPDFQHLPPASFPEIMFQRFWSSG